MPVIPIVYVTVTAGLFRTGNDENYRNVNETEFKRNESKFALHT